MNIKQAKELLSKYQAGTATGSENELVERWYNQLVETGEWKWSKGEKEMMQKLIEARLMRKINAGGPHRRPVFYHIRFQRWAAAAVILLFSAIGYFLINHHNSKTQQVAKVVSNDVKAPQQNKAVIRLANGKMIYLDSVGNGALALQGNVQLIKLSNGQIAYTHKQGEVSTKMEYNTLSNPRGSKVIHMVLSDGSKVWLDVASSITYPVSFTGKERRVSITGEAYFEVAHDAMKPFYVNHRDMNIRVLGTHFNVNAFEDEGADIKVTLLEGKVNVNNQASKETLKPGQQAIVNDKIKVINDVDLDEVMGWKNGYFEFNNSGLANVLSQVSRWYNVDVVYKGYNKPRQFMGEIQRDLNLSEILKILAKNGIQFQIEGNKLIVLPDKI
ncbi:MAG TPA: FecR domain-containing protein [Hanamia sp.]|nr:FecR domain-containing protein [Hanamia sp.]